MVGSIAKSITSRGNVTFSIVQIFLSIFILCGLKSRCWVCEKGERILSGGRFPGGWIEMRMRKRKWWKKRLGRERNNALGHMTKCYILDFLFLGFSSQFPGERVHMSVSLSLSLYPENLQSSWCVHNWWSGWRFQSHRATFKRNLNVWD